MTVSLLALLVACSPAHRAARTYSGTLEPRYWGTAPGYGEKPDDGLFTALVLRFDKPIGGESFAVYSANTAEDITPDAAAAACMYGRVAVEGTYVTTTHPFVPGVLTGARVLSCTASTALELPFGEEVTLTGTLRRRWWYGPPGWGADPLTDQAQYGLVLLVDGMIVPLNLDRSDAELERSRRYGFACEGQEVTVRGTVEPRKDPTANPPYNVKDARMVAPCSAPSIDRGRTLPPKPMPPEWLQ